MLDIDGFGKEEGGEWVYRGSQPWASIYRYSLIVLSPGGSDAVELSELDLIAKRFVKESFSVPLAKSDVSWIDKDTVFIATDWGPAQ